MLERYSKTKSFMFVRKRKAARKKRKEQAENPEAGATATGGVPDEENEEDIQAERDMPSYAEHAFTFTAFERVSLVPPGGTCQARSWTRVFLVDIAD